MNETKGNRINWTLLLPSYSYITKNSRAERTRRPASELDSSFQQEYRYILPYLAVAQTVVYCDHF
jgi:hypothetical protein